jgi:hypothetical protein
MDFSTFNIKNKCGIPLCKAITDEKFTKEKLGRD